MDGDARRASNRLDDQPGERSGRDALEAAYKAWWETPMPRGTADEATDDLHTDLYVVDMWVADTVIPYVEHGIYEPAVPDVLGTLRELMAAFAAMLDAAVSVADQAGLRAHIEYGQLLETVYVLMLVDAEASQPPSAS